MLQEKDVWVNKGSIVHSVRMKPTIVYEDDDVLAIDKPAGLLVHPDGKSDEYTLSDWVVQTFPQTASVGESIETDDDVIERPGIVHRLDRDTSGIMLVAKTKKGFSVLKEQFQERGIKKIYYAFISGTPQHSRGLIHKPIGRSISDFRQWSAERNARGEKRDAVTRYIIKESGQGCSYVQAMPETGRTHQIRVHFKSIRHPLLGDVLYGDKKPNTLGFTRVALHSHSVEFINTEGVQVRAEAPLPMDFARALELLRKS